MVKSTKYKLLIGFGAVFMVLAALFFLSSFLLSLFLTKELDKGIYKEVIVTSNISEGYKYWSTNYFEEAPPYYTVAHFFNLTNPDEVLSGSKPIYEELGPYYYLEYREKINIEFSENESFVTYGEYRHYTFAGGNSSGDDTDLITNINFGLLGAIKQAGNANDLKIGMSGPVIGNFMNWFTGPFLTHVVVDFLSNSSGLAAARADLQNSPPCNKSALCFLAGWANVSNDPTPDWAGMIVSAGSASSGISLESAQGLWNASIPNSLLNPNASAMWYMVLNGNSTAADEIATAFNLTEPQMDMIVEWINGSLTTMLIQPSLIEAFSYLGVTEWTDLGWAQYGTGEITGGVSVFELYPDEWDAVPEYGLAPVGAEIIPLDVAVVKEFINGTYGISNIQNFNYFYQVIEEGPSGAAIFEANWGVPLEVLNTTAAFSFYFFEYIPNTFATPLFNQFTEKQNAGMFVTHTVDEWLFGATDALLTYIQPDNPYFFILQNNTSPENAALERPASTYYTGKGNISMIGSYVDYEGQEIINGVYAFPMRVNGTNEWGQFQPLLSQTKNYNLGTFNEQYLRHMTLNFTDEISEKGLKLWRYELDNITNFGIRPQYYQTIQGFANMTSFYNDSPIFISNPHFFAVDNELWINETEGIEGNFSTDQTFFDIEPNSGKVLRLYKALQINTYVTNEDIDYIYMEWPSMRGNMFYPVGWFAEQSDFNEDNANQIKDTIYVVGAIHKYGDMACLLAGFFFMLLSSTLFVIALQIGSGDELSVQNYHPINAQE